MGSTSHNMSTKPPIGIEQDESSSEPRFFFCCTIKSSLSLKWLDLSRRKAYACTCSQGDWWSSILINNFHLQERSNFNQQASTWRCILNPPTYTENLYKLVYIYVSRAGEVLLKLPWPLILLLYKNQTLQRFGPKWWCVCSWSCRLKEGCTLEAPIITPLPILCALRKIKFNLVE